MFILNSKYNILGEYLKFLFFVYIYVNVCKIFVGCVYFCIEIVKFWYFLVLILFVDILDSFNSLVVGVVVGVVFLLVVIVVIVILFIRLRLIYILDLCICFFKIR